MHRHEALLLGQTVLSIVRLQALEVLVLASIRPITLAVAAVAAVGTLYVLVHERRRRAKALRRADLAAKNGTGGTGSASSSSDMMSREQLLTILEESSTAAYQLIEQVRQIDFPARAHLVWVVGLGSAEGRQRWQRRKARWDDLLHLMSGHVLTGSPFVRGDALGV